ncbi:hypothetical protein SK128_002585, partial [Halocaridina rubra]
LETGPSPESEFISQPVNVTVPVSAPVLLKCTVASKASLCRWYYLELGLQFFDKRITPMLVKEFNPANRLDCSIKIAKVRKVQEGQWVCQALQFHTSKFLMTKPAIVRVITEEESITWKPPAHDSNLTPRSGRRDDENEEPKEINGNKISLEFDSKYDDMIKDVFVDETALLKCQVNQPISMCSWITPNGLNISATEDYETASNTYSNVDNYTIYSSLSEGNCSMKIHKLGYHDEGNWRCVVKSADEFQDRMGPIIHLHILDENSASKHTHDEKPHKVEKEGSTNFLVVFLVTVSVFLFIIIILLLICIYRRYRDNSDEKQNFLTSSPRNSLDYQRKVIPITDLTADSVMAVEPRKKLPFEENHFNHYTQYLDMSGTGSTIGDGYIMMPGSSIRSSTSSRTTLSTLSLGRSRSASNSTTSSANFPHLIDNPSYNLNVSIQQRGLPRPSSLYSTDHVYEEIKEKMELIPEADTPTYTNTVEDFEGYLIPKHSPITDAKHEENINLASPIKTSSPDPSKTSNKILNKDELLGYHEERPPPYSQIGDLVQTGSQTQNPKELPIGYSRVGNDNATVPVDPMDRYDIPRPIPYNPIDSYDVPRQIPISVQSQTITTVEDKTLGNGLTGIIV